MAAEIEDSLWTREGGLSIPAGNLFLRYFRVV
jgi:hypothetical protein